MHIATRIRGRFRSWRRKAKAGGRWAALALVLVGASCSSTGLEPRPALEEPYRVLLLGDSISIGYTPFVREIFGERAEVVRPLRDNGSAQNCQGTRFGVEHVREWVAIDGGGWDVIHFNFGLHDLKRVQPDTGKNSTDPSHPRQSEPDAYERNLREIVETLRSTGARLVFATTTPVPEGGVKPHRDPADVPRYNAIGRAIALDANADVNDLFAFVAPRLAELQNPVDVHFSREGSRALAGEVVRAIERAAAARP